MQESSLLPVCKGAAYIIVFAARRARSTPSLLRCAPDQVCIYFPPRRLLHGGPLAGSRMSLVRHTAAALAGSVTSFRAALRIAYFFPLPTTPLVRSFAGSLV